MGIIGSRNHYSKVKHKATRPVSWESNQLDVRLRRSCDDKRKRITTPCTGQSHYADIMEVGNATKVRAACSSEHDNGNLPKVDPDQHALFDIRRQRFDRDAASDSAHRDRHNITSNRTSGNDFRSNRRDQNVERVAKDFANDTSTVTDFGTNKETSIEELVRIHKSVIVESVRVPELLPFLLFLDDIEAIQAAERESSKRAVDLLLEQLRHSSEPGKWTTFLNSLKIAGYHYLASLLMGDPVHDISNHKNILKIFTPVLVENLLPGDLIHILYAKAVISQTDVEEVQCELKNKGPTAATLLLLDRVPRRQQNWYHEFRAALNESDYKFLADTLDEPAQTDCFQKEKQLSQTTKEATKERMKDGQAYNTPKYSSFSRQNRADAHNLPPPPRPHLPAFIKKPIDNETPSALGSLKSMDVENSTYAELFAEKKRLVLEIIVIEEEGRLKKDIQKLRSVKDALKTSDVEEKELNKSKRSLQNEVQARAANGEDGITAFVPAETVTATLSNNSDDLPRDLENMSNNTGTKRVQSEKPLADEVKEDSLKSNKDFVSNVNNAILRQSLSNVSNVCRCIQGSTSRSVNDPVQYLDLVLPLPRAQRSAMLNDSGLGFNVYAFENSCDY